jgi:hypothetical protein
MSPWWLVAQVDSGAEWKSSWKSHDPDATTHAKLARNGFHTLLLSTKSSHTQSLS